MVKAGTDWNLAGLGPMATRINAGAVQQLSARLNGGVIREATDGQLPERHATGGGDMAGQAFAALVERHGPMVLKVCRSVLRDDQESQGPCRARPREDHVTGGAV